MEGYTLPTGFIAKELAVIFPNSEYAHYLFEKPNNFVLSLTDKKTLRYATRHLNNLSYDDGDIPYNQIGPILQKLTNYSIYTYSEIVKNFIQVFLPTTVVINTQDLGYQLPKTLPDPSCFRIHRPRYCAKAKALAVKNFIEHGQNSGSVDVQGAEQF